MAMHVSSGMSCAAYIGVLACVSVHACVQVTVRKCSSPGDTVE